MAHDRERLRDLNPDFFTLKAFACRTGLLSSDDRAHSPIGSIDFDENVEGASTQAGLWFCVAKHANPDLGVGLCGDPAPVLVGGASRASTRGPFVLTKVGQTVLNLTPYVLKPAGNVDRDYLRIALQIATIYGGQDAEPVLTTLLGTEKERRSDAFDSGLEQSGTYNFFTSLWRSPALVTLLAEARLSPLDLEKLVDCYNKPWPTGLLDHEKGALPPLWGQDLAAPTVAFTLKHKRWPISREEALACQPVLVKLPEMGGAVVPYGVALSPHDEVLCLYKNSVYFAKTSGDSLEFQSVTYPLTIAPGAGSPGPRGREWFGWVGSFEGLPPDVTTLQALRNYAIDRSEMSVEARSIVKFFSNVGPKTGLTARGLKQLGDFLSKELFGWGVQTSYDVKRNVLELELAHKNDKDLRNRVLPLDVPLPRLLSFLYVQGLPDLLQARRLQRQMSVGDKVRDSTPETRDSR